MFFSSVSFRLQSAILMPHQIVRLEHERFLSCWPGSSQRFANLWTINNLVRVSRMHLQNATALDRFAHLVGQRVYSARAHSVDGIPVALSSQAIATGFESRNWGSHAKS
jgi:hypothetical protein